jgi:excisionase family DNA binding protein
MSVEKLYGIREAAQLMSLSHWTLRAWISKGKIKRTKLGGRTLIGKSELERFIRAGQTAKANGNGSTKAKPHSKR